mmetsp:Transcript_37873/g.55794  ORF Transcript_37873/g.55794 Transcript_37873/m.55794 type:complete len:111 (-) Transcript_37873:154-486(-)
MSEGWGTETANSVKQSIEVSLQALLNGVEYTPGAAKLLCGKISETSVQQLAQLKLPFKFLVTANIFEKGLSSMHQSSSCLWEDDKDGAVTIRYENKSLSAVVVVFAVALQ